MSVLIERLLLLYILSGAVMRNGREVILQVSFAVAHPLK